MATRNGWRIIVLVVVLLNTLPGTYAQAEPPATACLWCGVIPTVVTPFCDQGVDVAALERQIRYQLQGGCRGLLLLGTIGEGQYVNAQERADAIRTAVSVAGGAPVIVGIHTCDLETARAELLQAKELGAAAVLVKYLGNPHASADQVLGFYAALSDLRALPIVYYHYPSQTGLRLSPRAIADILGLPGVIGIKESTLDLGEMKAHICLTRGLGKCYYTSTALNLTQFLELGGSGAMCPEAVLLPSQVVDEYNAWINGHHDQARALQKALFVLEPVVSSGRVPVILARPLAMMAADRELPLPMSPNSHPQAKIKAALNCLGVATPVPVKCPLPPLSTRDRHKVQKACARIKAIDWCEVVLKVPPVPLSHGANVSNNFFFNTAPILLGPGAAQGFFGWPGNTRGGF
jgi:4-hydroxy-tetrahydrodipicolinate synthase